MVIGIIGAMNEEIKKLKAIMTEIKKKKLGGLLFFKGKLKDKNIVIFTTGLTPSDCRDYYDKIVIERNFKMGVPDNVKIFNFPGKMVLEELTIVHRTAIKALKKMMAGKENPTEMEKMLVELCDRDGDFSDRACISDLIKYVNGRE